ncbi:MAG: hypothetical protein ACREVK_12330, partial [Gammaproteobacteria bacterium]
DDDLWISPPMKRLTPAQTSWLKRNKADNCIAVWRDLADENSRVVEIHVQKVRFKDVGRVGKAELIYHRLSGRYFDVGEAPEEVVYGFA